MAGWEDGEEEGDGLSELGSQRKEMQQMLRGTVPRDGNGET
jgi:hypothetical protein